MKSLINLLAQQEDNLNSLLEIISGYQKALVAGDLNEMEYFLESEQKTLSSIQSNVAIQHDLIQDISTRFNLNISQFSIKDLINYLPKGTKDLNKLNYFMKTLKNLTVRISEKNQVNGILINHSRNFIREVINSLIHNNQRLLDRKI